jgi:hypothetical protein
MILPPSVFLVETLCKGAHTLCTLYREKDREREKESEERERERREREREREM